MLLLRYYFIVKEYVILCEASGKEVSLAYYIQENRVIIKNRGEIRIIWRTEIIYIYSLERKLYIKTASGSYSFYQRLDVFEAELCDMDFLRIHKSFLVNAEQVTGIQKHHILLKNGELLEISRKYLQNVRGYYCISSLRDSQSS
ncbi:MAG: LytTR family transcriptional regulator [Lachnospiraceae bacterium]|nr:LytTR family transcriptional regulator [Lachnospiraceae bacterium]